jgi:hypothetical protein
MHVSHRVNVSLRLGKPRSTKGLVFEDAPTTTLILRWLVHLQKRAASYCVDLTSSGKL